MKPWRLRPMKAKPSRPPARRPFRSADACPPSDQEPSGRPRGGSGSGFSRSRTLPLGRCALFTRQHKARRLVGATGLLGEGIEHRDLHILSSPKADGFDGWQVGSHTNGKGWNCHERSRQRSEQARQRGRRLRNRGASECHRLSAGRTIYQVRELSAARSGTIRKARSCLT